MPLQRPELRVSDPVPLYAQVAEWVEASIQRGEVKPGDRLPAVRDLAEDWEIAGNTVTRAWRILRERGVIISSHGKGTFVAARTGEPTGQ